MGKEHYTRNTVSIMKYCARCKRDTMHLVSDRRVGNSCTECINGKTLAATTKPDSVVIEVPCFCRKYKFPHYHPSKEEKLVAMKHYGIHPISTERKTL